MFNVKIFLIEWLARMLPDCDATTRIISEAMDRKVSLKERIRIRLHVFVCIGCARYKDQIQMLRDTVRKGAVRASTDRPMHIPPLSDDARERMKRRLSGE